MNTNTKGAFLLLSSIVLSSVLTYLLTKAKYEKKPAAVGEPEADIQPKKQEEIPDKPQKTVDHKDVDVIKYAEKYKRMQSELIRDYIPDPAEHPTIELIDEDLYETMPEYDSTSYTLYANKVLADEQNKIVFDPENSVGREAVERFNELEHNGAVYVRNHAMKMDFEILRDLRNYDETVGGSRGKS